MFPSKASQLGMVLKRRETLVADGHPLSSYFKTPTMGTGDGKQLGTAIVWIKLFRTAVGWWVWWEASAMMHVCATAAGPLGSSLVIEDVELAMVTPASQEAQPDRPPCRLLMLS